MAAIELPAPARITGVGLIPGYAKTDPATGKDRFGENRRIREVRWHFDDGTAVAQRFQDQPTMQQIAVEATTSRVVVEILTTLPGDPDHDYTSISDISILGWSEAQRAGMYGRSGYPGTVASDVPFHSGGGWWPSCRCQ